MILPSMRIELTTPCLRDKCSTTELRGPDEIGNLKLLLMVIFASPQDKLGKQDPDHL